MKFILYLALIYFGYLLIRFLIRLFIKPGKSSAFSNVRPKKKNKIEIDKKDIIDADFEELDKSKEKDSKKNN